MGRISKPRNARTLQQWFVVLFLGLILASTQAWSADSTRSVFDPPVRQSRALQDTVAQPDTMPATTVQSQRDGLVLTIRNVDISEWPFVNVIVEAFNEEGEPLDTLVDTDLTIMENQAEIPVLSVEKLSVNERVPVDFVFVIDVTGSMQTYIDGVRNNIINFTSSLVRRGIDYKLGLVLFSDVIDNAYSPSGDVIKFLEWLANTRASGGSDFNENALEALATAARMDFRPSANKVFVLITDAPYHQKGDHGQGVTSFTTPSITTFLSQHDARVFCIVPKTLEQYKVISNGTRGATFDINQSFATILDNFSNQLTNLYALKYRSGTPAIPDSLEIGILDKEKRRLTLRTIPIGEVGRKLIIKNLLFGTGSADLQGTVPALDTIAMYMERKPTVAIRVEGHTDSRGSNQLNQRLSEQRAEAVRRYLVRAGIPAERIQVFGYGESKPIATNETEFGRSLNRRTEIVIVRK